jgi:hypothetical protein
MWAAFHYTNPWKAQLTPELQVEVNRSPQVCADFDSKVTAFQILFPTPPRDPPTPTTPARPELPWQTFLPAEIKSAIYTSSPWKAPGPDSLTFACLRRAYAAILDHFNKLYSTLGAIGYHPRPWRQSTIVVILKPNKPNYSNPKAYRPIALLNCLGKVLEKLIAARLSSMAENHDLLHLDQIGGRPQRSAIDAAMALTHDIEIGCSKCLTMTTLFLNMRGVFDNISSTGFTSTMRQLGYPAPVVLWCRSFLMEQTMALSFDGRTHIQWPMAIGIPQGSPASPILFLLYLHPLFDSLQIHDPSIWSLSYIDHVVLVAQGKIREGNSRALEAAAWTAFQWARDNTVVFDDAKSEMLYFHRSRWDIITEETKIQLPHGMVVEPGIRGGKSDVVWWIGIFFDRKLIIKYVTNLRWHALRSYCGLFGNMGNQCNDYYLLLGDQEIERVGGIRDLQRAELRWSFW